MHIFPNVIEGPGLIFDPKFITTAIITPKFTFLKKKNYSLFDRSDHKVNVINGLLDHENGIFDPLIVWMRHLVLAQK